MSCLWCIDHDGTASHGDIGRDYLCRLMDFDSEGFVEEVMKMRNDPEYRAEILRGEKYEVGMELAFLLVYHRVKQDDVREIARNAEDYLREGFLEFLNDPDTGRSIIFTAGVGDFSKLLYDKPKFRNKKNFDTVGTDLYVDEEGRYSGIKSPCGKESKPDRIKEVMRGMNGNNIIKIGIGDSQGDRRMFEYVLENGGLTIGIGDGIEGDINFPKDTAWYPVWEAGKLYVDFMEKSKKEALYRIKEHIEVGVHAD